MWRFRRSFSSCLNPLKSSKKDSISDAEDQLMLNRNEIMKYFDISYARSSGAGGQHVNTTDSKAVLRLTASKWYAARGKWIPPKFFDNIMNNLANGPTDKKFPYFTPSGDVLITSSLTRYRDKNLDNCVTKFVDSIKTCSMGKKETSLETVAKWEKIKKVDNENRLKEKKMKKDKKTSRRKISLYD